MRPGSFGSVLVPLSFHFSYDCKTGFIYKQFDPHPVKNGYQKGLFQATVVGDVFSLSLFSSHLLIHPFHHVVIVLINDTLLSLNEVFHGLMSPPRNFIAMLIVSSTIIIESMSDLMSNDRSNA